MTMDPNDPRLTAYALDELDAEERAEVEALLADDAAARAAVEEICAVAGMLTDALASEPSATLTEAQRAQVDQRLEAAAATPAAVSTRRGRAWRGARLPLALAACVGVVLVVGALVTPSKKQAKTSAAFRTVDDNLGGPAPSIKAQANLSEAERQGLQSLGYVGDARGVNRATLKGSINLDASMMPQAGDYAAAGTNVVGMGASEGLALWGANLKSTGYQMYYVNADRVAGLEDSYDLDDSSEIPPGARVEGQFDRETCARIVENPYLPAQVRPLSTFSIDVDTASYANVRRFLNGGQLPPPDAVRIEEMVNYFAYDYPEPGRDRPFSVSVDIADCPWRREHLLARIGLKGYEIPRDERPDCNLVFLIDVSGSMRPANKLPLVQRSLRLLVEELDAYDRVALVVYAGASGLVLDSTAVDEPAVILDAIDRLQAGGSTNGGAGIQLAYQVAADNFIDEGVNRVILATDGDFNVGITDRGALIELIEEQAATGVFLSVLGYGMGNYQDATLEQLADKGNGNYAYIDTLDEARKVLVDEMGGTLITIAKDVKIQVEFNPAEVAGYRLIGYENRVLAARDFNDDAKDAGEIGAGHTVTALYEIIPAGADGIDLGTSGAAEADENIHTTSVDPLKYQTPAGALVASDEIMTVKLRYKPYDGDTSVLVEVPVVDEGYTLNDMSDDYHHAAAVAAFGMLLRGSVYAGDADFADVEGWARAGNSAGVSQRSAFLELVEKAAELADTQ